MEWIFLTLFHLELHLVASSQWAPSEHPSNNKIAHGEISSIAISADSSGLIGREFVEWRNRNTRLILAALQCIILEKFLVFATTSGKVPNSAVFRHRGIWRNPKLQPVPKTLEVHPEALFSCEGGLRFSAMAIAGESELDWVARVLSEHEYLIAIFSNSGPIEIESSVSKLTRLGFPPDGCGEGDWPDGISWPGIADFFCSRELIFLKSCAFHGDRMCKWEIVGQNGYLTSLVSQLRSFFQSFEVRGTQLH